MLFKSNSFKIFFYIFLIFPFLVNSQNIPKPIGKPQVIKKKYSELFHEVKKQNWQIAKSIAADYNNKNLITYIEWLDITRAGNKHSFDHLTNFLENNPNWPSEEIIKKKIESSITSTDSSEKILDWFKKNSPLTVKGEIELFEAKLRLGLIENKAESIRNIWINKNLTYQQQRYFIKKYSKYWTNEDNWKRFDRLLWDGKTTSARRTLKRMHGDRRKLGNARLALSTRAGNVSGLIKQVPNYLKSDPGLIYERMRWRRKAKLDSAAEFLINPPEEIKNHRNWWINARIVIRRLINKKNYIKAYQLLKNHKIPLTSISGTEAEWLAGWVALTFLNKPQIAIDHFGMLYNSVNHPSSKSKAAFWMAKSMAVKGAEKAKINKWFSISSQYKHSFYSQRASFKIENFKFEENILTENKPVCCKHLLNITNILIESDEERRVYPFLLKSFRLSDNIEERNFILNLSSKLKNKNVLVKLSKNDSHKKLNYSYPVIRENIPSKFFKKNDLALINAIILQESAFMVDAYSSAGANGLMQLMPYTAKLVARSLGIKYYRKALRTNSEYNILLGTTYIKGLLKDFNNSLPLALAGYNAGPGRVKIWLRRYGDPRKNEISYINWIESIPISETRKYVKKVIANYRIYQKIFKSKDLENSFLFS